MKKTLIQMLCLLILACMLVSCANMSAADTASSDKDKPSNASSVTSIISESIISISESIMSESEENSASIFFIGSWNYLYAFNGNDGYYDTFSYTLIFNEDETVEYQAGWYNSEIASIYQGRYSYDGANKVSLHLEHIWEEHDPANNQSVSDSMREPIECVLYVLPDSFSRLMVVLISGDKLYFHQELESPVWYTKIS